MRTETNALFSWEAGTEDLSLTYQTWMKTENRFLGLFLAMIDFSSEAVTVVFSMSAHIFLLNISLYFFQENGPQRLILWTMILHTI